MTPWAYVTGERGPSAFVRWARFVSDAGWRRAPKTGRCCWWQPTPWVWCRRRRFEGWIYCRRHLTHNLASPQEKP